MVVPIIMGKSKVCVFVLWRLLMCSFFAGLSVGCREDTRERAVSELRFELQPLTSPETCFPSHRSKWVCEYFSSEDLHAELGKTLGRTAKDVGNSLTVDPFGDSYDQFTLRAEGKDGDEAGVLASAALARFEGYLIESRQRCNELSLAQIERQIEEQKLKVEAAKAKMDAAFEKLKSAQSEDR